MTSISDLPPELLCLIAGRLHTAVDAIRFHSVCRSWRDTLHDLPPPRQRGLLPWLLAPSPTSDSDDDTETAAGVACRCVFSKTSYQSPGLCVRDKRVAHADGTASWFINGDLVNPLTAKDDTKSPRYPSSWIEHEGFSHLVVSGDGTFLVYRFSNECPWMGSSYLSLKGHIWTPGKKVGKWVDTRLGAVDTVDRCAVAAYHGGFIVCVDLADCYIHKKGVRKCMPLPDEPPGKVRRRCFLVELRGELLLASVLQDDDGCDRLSVSVHAFDVDAAVYALDPDADDQAVWERRDGVLGDHVLFLGFPSSFAVEAARFGGELPGGSAYFVVSSEPCRARVYSCSIDGGAATVVETLPDGWNDERCMWFLPQPDIAEKYDDDDEETAIATLYRIERRPRNLRFYAGGLSPTVDSAQLREMYSKYGKVLQAKVECDKRGRSRGFGFVTMATVEDYNRVFSRRPQQPTDYSTMDFVCELCFIALLLFLTYYGITSFYRLIGRWIF